jgi:hypothetical protein
MAQKKYHVAIFFVMRRFDVSFCSIRRNLVDTNSLTKENVLNNNTYNLLLKYCSDLKHFGTGDAYMRPKRFL